MGFLRLSLLLMIFAAISNSMRYRCDRELTTCGCGYEDVNDFARVINGRDANPYSWSMIVSLRAGDPNAHICGGTILSEYFILTAAHCIEQDTLTTPSRMVVHAGIHYLSERNAVIRHADNIYVHPNWEGSVSDKANDIALIHLSQPLDVSTNPYLSRTCLPRIGSLDKVTAYPPNGTLLMAVGWGLTNGDAEESPQVLQQVTLNSIDHTHSRCVSLMKDSSVQFCSALYQGSAGRDTRTTKLYLNSILSRCLCR